MALRVAGSNPVSHPRNQRPADTRPAQCLQGFPAPSAKYERLFFIGRSLLPAAGRKGGQEPPARLVRPERKRFGLKRGFAVLPPQEKILRRGNRPSRQRRTAADRQTAVFMRPNDASLFSPLPGGRRPRQRTSVAGNVPGVTRGLAGPAGVVQQRNRPGARAAVIDNGRGAAITHGPLSSAPGVDCGGGHYRS